MALISERPTGSSVSGVQQGGLLVQKKQEAQGPWFPHLSDITTADMQMLCNIFPILSSQLMKYHLGSS